MPAGMLRNREVSGAFKSRSAAVPGIQIQLLKNDIVAGNDCVKKYYQIHLVKGSSV